MYVRRFYYIFDFRERSRSASIGALNSLFFLNETLTPIQSSGINTQGNAIIGNATRNALIQVPCTLIKPIPSRFTIVYFFHDNEHTIIPLLLHYRELRMTSYDLH